MVQRTTTPRGHNQTTPSWCGDNKLWLVSPFPSPFEARRAVRACLLGCFTPRPLSKVLLKSNEMQDAFHFPVDASCRVTCACNTSQRLCETRLAARLNIFTGRVRLLPNRESC